MNETVTKRFLLYFRLMMVAWILIANAFFHAIEFEYSWLVFLSNIMLFTMEGDIKDRFISVELGGLVGMVLTTSLYYIDEKTDVSERDFIDNIIDFVRHANVCPE